MKKIRNRKQKVLVIVAIFAVLILIFAYFFKVGQNEIYTSDTMQIVFVVPQGLEVSERFGSVKLEKDNSLILLDRNGTNFSNVDEYLQDLSVENGFKLKKQEKLKIDNMDAVRGEIEHPSSPNEDNLSYFIYVNNRVYTLSTSSESLYDDLDQIAKSFKYTGD